MKAIFVVNERSGHGRGRRVANLIARSRLFDLEIVNCGAKEELDPLIDRAEREAVDVVFAVGGDGTVHEVAKRLVGHLPALGIIPIGSGNGFARHIGVPLQPERALDVLSRATIETVDTAIVNEHPFIGVMGVGFDALIAERFASSRIRGLASYVREGLFAFRQRRAERYALAHDGGSLEIDAAVVAVANSGQYGNNARIAPLASLTDGLLDVVIIHDPALLALPGLLLRLFNGTLDRADGVTCIQTRHLSIQRSSAGAAHLDGEPFTLPAALEIAVRPKTLRLLLPDAGRRV